MTAALVNLGADVGESFGRWTLGNDTELMDFLSSANVACGFHAGDPSVMRATVAHATARGIAIGAQVSYPDLRGFGRRSMALATDELVADVLYQIAALDGLARTVGGHVTFLRPHGALYHDAATDPRVAAALVDAAQQWHSALAVVAQPGELYVLATTAGLRTHSEGFIDRRYATPTTLLPRSEPDALITDPAQAANQALELVARGFTTLCVHGDNPAAVQVAAATRAELERAGVTITWF